MEKGNVDRGVLPEPQHVEHTERDLVLGDHAEVMALLLEHLHLAHQGVHLTANVEQRLLAEAEQPVPA